MKSINRARSPRKDGTTPIQVTVRLPGYEESRSATCDTEDLCNKFAADAERLMRLQEPTLPTRHKPVTKEDLDNETLAATFKAFLKTKYALGRNKKHAPAITRNIGRITRQGITRRWVEDYIAHMREQTTNRGKPYSWETIATQLSLINKVLKWRAEDVQHPHVRVPFNSQSMFPRNWKGRRTRRLEPGEEDTLMNRLREVRSLSSRPFWCNFAQLSLETGARLQEVVLAEWSNVSWDTRTWFIPDSDSKTGDRHVPLSKRAIEIFGDLHGLRHPQSARIFHELGNPATVSALFLRYSRQSGLVNFKTHDLRHEAISRLVIFKRKMTLRQIGLMVGHSSEEMTEYYAHLRGDEIADLLD